MGETYVECLVSRERNTGAFILRGFVWALCAICLLLSLVGFTLLFIASIVFGVIAYFVCPCPDIEFEYLYIDKELSIDKIMAKQKRKHVLTVDLNNMEKMCPVSSHELDMFKGRNIKIKDFSSKKQDSKPYAIVLHDTAGESLVYIEPDETLIKVLKQVFPRKIIEF